jgi:hypothetical protein
LKWLRSTKLETKIILKCFVAAMATNFR